jgi:hypothetical protein
MILTTHTDHHHKITATEDIEALTLTQVITLVGETIMDSIMVHTVVAEVVQHMKLVGLLTHPCNGDAMNAVKEVMWTGGVVTVDHHPRHGMRDSRMKGEFTAAIMEIEFIEI